MFRFTLQIRKLFLPSVFKKSPFFWFSLGQLLIKSRQPLISKLLTGMSSSHLLPNHLSRRASLQFKYLRVINYSQQRYLSTRRQVKQKTSFSSEKINPWRNYLWLAGAASFLFTLIAMNNKSLNAESVAEEEIDPVELHNAEASSEGVVEEEVDPELLKQIDATLCRLFRASIDKDMLVVSKEKLNFFRLARQYPPLEVITDQMLLVSNTQDAHEYDKLLSMWGKIFESEFKDFVAASYWKLMKIIEFTEPVVNRLTPEVEAGLDQLFSEIALAKHLDDYAPYYRNFGVFLVTIKSVPDYHKAAQAFTKTIELGDKNYANYLRRAGCYLHLADYEQAITDATICIDNNYELAMAYNLRGEARNGLKKYVTAIGDLSEAIKLNNEQGSYKLNEDSYLSRGVAYFYLENYGKASKDFERATQLNQCCGVAYASLGAIYALQGDLDAALKEFDKALPHFKNDAQRMQAYEQRGEILRKMGRYHESSLSYRMAARLKEPNLKIRYLSDGEYYFSQQNYPKAIKSFKEAITLDKKDINSYIRAVTILLTVSEKAESGVEDSLGQALVLLKSAEQEQLDSARLAELHATVLEGLGQEVNAIAYYDKAINGTTEAADVAILQFKKALIYEKLTEYDNAVHIVNEFEKGTYVNKKLKKSVAALKKRLSKKQRIDTVFRKKHSELQKKEVMMHFDYALLCLREMDEKSFSASHLNSYYQSSWKPFDKIKATIRIPLDTSKKAATSSDAPRYTEKTIAIADYQAKAFINESTKDIVIVHHTLVKDMPAIINQEQYYQLMMAGLHGRANEFRTKVFSSMKNIPNVAQYRLSHTGYGVEGAVAEWIGYEHDEPAVSFNSSGLARVYGAVEERGTMNAQKAKTLLTSYKSFPSWENTLDGMTPGINIQLFPIIGEFEEAVSWKQWITQGIVNFVLPREDSAYIYWRRAAWMKKDVSVQLTYHLLSRMLAELQQPEHTHILIQRWPDSAVTFEAYMGALRTICENHPHWTAYMQDKVFKHHKVRYHVSPSEQANYLYRQSFAKNPVEALLWGYLKVKSNPEATEQRRQFKQALSAYGVTDFKQIDQCELIEKPQQIVIHVKGKFTAAELKQYLKKRYLKANDKSFNLKNYLSLLGLFKYRLPKEERYTDYLDELTPFFKALP